MNRTREHMHEVFLSFVMGAHLGNGRIDPPWFNYKYSEEQLRPEY